MEEERFLLGYLTNDYDRLDEEIADLYPTRWDSGFWIEEMSFMNLKHLPSNDLSKIFFNPAAKLVAYYTMSAFRGNLGEAHTAHNVKTIHDLFFKEQALVRLNNREELEVTIFGHEHAAVLEAVYSGLSKKLLKQGISPGVSWLNDYPLKFVSR